jgi:hypothetical protein
MKDPVILPSGHYVDRSTITQRVERPLIHSIAAHDDF